MDGNFGQLWELLSNSWNGIHETDHILQVRRTAQIRKNSEENGTSLISYVARLTKKSTGPISCMEKWNKVSLLKDFNCMNLKQANEVQSDIPEGKTEFWIENSFFTWVIWTFAQPTLFLIARIRRTFSIVKMHPIFSQILAQWKSVISHHFSELE